LVNRAFEQIAKGSIRSALIIGAEALHSFESARKQGIAPKEIATRWGEGELSADEHERLKILKQTPGLSTWPPGTTLAEANLFFSELWRKHGLGAPSASYPIIENALRVEEQRTLYEQQQRAAQIFAGFSEVAAAEKEHSWFGTAYTASELSTPSEDNRPICHPFYLKRLNSVMAVDMSAALLIMSAGEARRRGVPAHKWIFLHGCSEANDRI